MHHDSIHAVGHGERLEVGLDGHGEGQLVDEVDRHTGDNRSAAQVLEAENCGSRHTLGLDQDSRNNAFNNISY